MTKDATIITGRATSEGVDFDLSISGLKLDWEDAPLLHARVAISWTDEENAHRQAVFIYDEWVNESEIETIDRCGGWDKETGDDLPQYVRGDILEEVNRLIEGSDFDLRSMDVTREDAKRTLKDRNPNLFLGGRDPAAGHDWEMCEYLDESRGAYGTVRHFRTLGDVVAWAEDDRNFEDRDAA